MGRTGKRTGEGDGVANEGNKGAGVGRGVYSRDMMFPDASKAKKKKHQ